MSDSAKRIKELLEKSICNSSKVFIVGHNTPDYDSIGSALALSIIAKNYGKNAYIIVNDNDIGLDPGIKKILDENKKIHNIISLEECHSLIDEHSLLIATDVNKKYLVSVKNDLDKFSDILVIDHHEEDKETIPTTKKIVDLSASSVSEMITQVLTSLKIKYDQEIANYLLAGIILDTKSYQNNTTAITHDATKKLIQKGADLDYVNSLFLTEFDQEGKIELLIHTPGNTIFQEYEQSSLLKTRNITFTINRASPGTIYQKLDIAKAADKMLKFRVADASFVLGFLKENMVCISARSRSDINVGQIMGRIDYCGGNAKNAGGLIETDDIFAVEKKLMKEIQWGLPSLARPLEEPPITKEKRLRKA